MGGRILELTEHAAKIPRWRMTMISYNVLSCRLPRTNTALEVTKQSHWLSGHKREITKNFLKIWVFGEGFSCAPSCLLEQLTTAPREPNKTCAMADCASSGTCLPCDPWLRASANQGICYSGENFLRLPKILQNSQSTQELTNLTWRRFSRKYRECRAVNQVFIL